MCAYDFPLYKIFVVGRLARNQHKNLIVFMHHDLLRFSAGPVNCHREISVDSANEYLL